jgi:hypothetical protein
VNFAHSGQKRQKKQPRAEKPEPHARKRPFFKKQSSPEQKKPKKKSFFNEIKSLYKALNEGN